MFNRPRSRDTHAEVVADALGFAEEARQEINAAQRAVPDRVNAEGSGADGPGPLDAMRRFADAIRPEASGRDETVYEEADDDCEVARDEDCLDECGDDDEIKSVVGRVRARLRGAGKPRMRTVEQYVCDSCDSVIPVPAADDPGTGFVVRGNVYVADPTARGGLIGDNFPAAAPGEKIDPAAVRETVLCRGCFLRAIGISDRNQFAKRTPRGRTAADNRTIEEAMTTRDAASFDRPMHAMTGMGTAVCGPTRAERHMSGENRRGPGRPPRVMQEATGLRPMNGVNLTDPPRASMRGPGGPPVPVDASYMAEDYADSTGGPA